MKAFLDTNILVYANDERDTRKQEIALDIVARHIRENAGVISTQVMQEYTVNAVQKLKQAIPVVMHQLHLLETLEVVAVSPDLVRRALEINQLYGTSYWDALIIAAAEKAGCDRIISEDLNSGQNYCGMRCENPFGGNP